MSLVSYAVQFQANAFASERDGWVGVTLVPLVTQPASAPSLFFWGVSPVARAVRGSPLPTATPAVHRVPLGTRFMGAKHVMPAIRGGHAGPQALVDCQSKPQAFRGMLLPETHSPTRSRTTGRVPSIVSTPEGRTHSLHRRGRRSRPSRFYYRNCDILSERYRSVQHTHTEHNEAGLGGLGPRCLSYACASVCECAYACACI